MFKWSCVFGQFWVIFIFAPFSHILLKGVNGSNHTDIEHFIWDSGTGNMTFLYLMLSGDKEH